MKEHTIWSSFPNYDDYKDFFDEEYPYVGLEDREDIMYRMNYDYLEDERINLDILLPNKIIAISLIEMWNCRELGYFYIDSNNIKDCLYSNYEPVWFVDRFGDFRCNEYHHDGVNHILYRELKSNLSIRQIDNFYEKIINGTLSRKDITYYTKSLGKTISQVYGW